MERKTKRPRRKRKIKKRKNKISLINNRTTSSAIEFNIEEAAKEIFRNSLRAYLENLVSNLLLQKDMTANMPEYVPINVVEVK